MRINKLHIDGFGIYRERQFTTSAPLTVFYGPNEAGKSTLLAFIRTVLYGFPTSNTKQFYPPQSEGEHGGRLVIANDAMDIFVVERHRGPRGGPLVVRSHGSEVSNGALTVEQLVGHQPRNVFEHYLSFNLDELSEVSSKKAKTTKDITSQFYTAATGANSLQEAVANLQKRRQNIYTKQGTKKYLTERLNNLTKLDQNLRDIEGQSAEYADLTRQINNLTTSLDTSEEQKQQLEIQLAEVKRYVNSWPLWREIVKLEETLASESQAENFPAEPISRLKSFEDTIKDHQTTVDSLDAEITALTEQAELAITYETLIGESAQCESLIEGKKAHQGACRDLKAREAAVASAKDDVNHALSDVGRDWTEERVKNLDISTPQLEQVKGWKKRFTASHGQMQKEEADLRNLKSEHRNQELAVTRCESNDDLTLGNQIKEKVALIEKALELKEKHTAANAAYVQALQNFPRNHQSSSEGPTSRRFHLIIGTLSLSLLALAGFLEQPWYGLVGLVGLVGLGYAALAWRRNDTPEDASILEHDAEQTKVSNAHQAFMTAAAQLGFSDPDSVEASDLTKEKELLDTEIRHRKTLNDALQFHFPFVQRTAQIETKETQERLIAEQNDEWCDWLTSNGFPGTLKPDQVDTFIAHVKTTRETIKSLRKEEKRLYGVEQDIKEYRQDVKKLAGQHDIPLDESVTDATVWTEQIKTRLEQANKEQTDRKNAKNSLQKLTIRQKTAIAQLTRELNNKSDLLKAAKAKDVEEFRRKANEWDQLQQTRSEFEQKREQLCGMWMNDHPYDDLAKKCQAKTEREITDELQRLETALSGLANRHKDEMKERADLESARKSMDGDDKASKYRMEREVEQTQANELAEEWSTLIVAQWLLEQARRKYEKERQPAVIEKASIWFERMTGRRYARIVPPVDGTGEFSVIDRHERTKKPNQLSRGTKDQLYLSLRFGLIQSLESHGERLPVIVDEALVNCDPDRARVAVEAFAELARTNQVLVMTCHPWMRDLFEEVSPNTKVIELDS